MSFDRAAFSGCWSSFIQVHYTLSDGSVRSKGPLMNCILAQISIDRLTERIAILRLLEGAKVRVLGNQAEHGEGVKRNDEIVHLSAQRFRLARLVAQLDTVELGRDTQPSEEFSGQRRVFVFVKQRVSEKMIEWAI